MATDHAKVGQRQSGYNVKFRKLFAVKEGVDKLLDVARVAYDDCRNDVMQSEPFERHPAMNADKDLVCRDFSCKQLADSYFTPH